MNRVLTATVLIGAMALGACTNPNRFGGGTGDPGAIDPNAGLTGPGGIDQTGLGDPTSPQYFSQAVGDRVLFAVDQHTLTPQAQATLRGQAQWLLANSEYLALIEGHADERGTREYNLALGARRAQAVVEFLVSQGIPASRLNPTSYGKLRPIATCSDESCNAQNRRAVTVISIGTLG